MASVGEELFAMPYSPGTPGAVRLPDITVNAGLRAPDPPPPGGMLGPAVQVNKAKWAQFFDRLRLDPNMRQAVMQTGMQLMRTPAPGQGSFDVAANAVGAGAQTLAGLREKDRLLAEQAAAKRTAEEQRQLENQQRTTELEYSGRRTAATEAQNAATAEHYRALEGNEAAKLAETTRSNRAGERIRGVQAEADLIRAKAYGSGLGGGGARTPAEIQKINILARQFVNQGMTEDEAQARAVQYVTETGKNTDPAKLAAQLYQGMLQAWTSNLDNIGKPLDDATRKQMLENAKAAAKDLSMLGTAETPVGPPATTVAPRAPVAGAPTAVAGTPVAGPPIAPAGRPDPAIQAKVAMAKQMGRTPEEIKAALTQIGVDPKLYGF